MQIDKYIGRLLDNRYEIQEVIGVGGMAVVYKARCHRLNRLVAVKILKDDYSQDEDFRRRFHAEGQAVAMVSHPNIVSVYDVSTSNEADYIVMELIEGISLKQYMEKKGVLNWKETLHFSIQIAKALEHAHGKGIVHRDIKPHNVMVLKDGSVKVADFGIARVMSESNTLTREALGSVHYISPEQAKGGRVDNRSDIYSLGVVMYEMMTGRPPYNGDSPVAVAIQHINGGAVMPTLLNPGIPAGLEQIIMKAMALEPGQRYNSATAMLYDMDEFRKMPTMIFGYGAESGVGQAAAVNSVGLGTTPRRTPGTGERSGASGQSPRRRTDTGSRAAAAAAAGQPRRRPSASAAARKKQQEDNSRAATVAIIACAAVALIAVIVFLIVLFGSVLGNNKELVKVPTLLGQNYEQLRDQYEFSENFRIRLNSERDYNYSSQYEAGEIMDQNPEPGKEVAKGTYIYVTVSIGPEPEVKEMIDVAGKTAEEARSMLKALDMNLIVMEEPVFDDEVEPGIVVSFDPAVGTKLTEGQTIKLNVSEGPEIQEGEMPDLVGNRVEDASKKLDNQDLELDIQVEEEENMDYEEGTVFRTSPAAGDTIRTGDTVTLFVAKGMKKELMPSLTGMTQEDAEKAIQTLVEDLKLVVEVVEDFKDGVREGTVLKTEPSYNQNIQTGDTVKIFVCAQKKAKMPDLVGKDLQTAKDLLDYAGFTNVTVTPGASGPKKDVVLSQSHEKSAEVAIDTEIEVVVCVGPVTKADVSFELPGGGGEDPGKVTVVITNVTTGEEVFNDQVSAADTEVKVDLTGYGKMTYEVTVDGMVYSTGLDIVVDFDAE